MVLPDVNVLVYAFREDTPDHTRYADWVSAMMNGPQAFGLADQVLSGFLRITTHPGIYNAPSTINGALRFVEQLTGLSHCVRIAPGPRHWRIFVDLCRSAGVRGNLVPDAYLAAMAIESGCEWITADRGFARFPGLKWRTPF